MIYQSTTGISAGTNKRKMRNRMPPAGLARRIPLAPNKIKDQMRLILARLSTAVRKQYVTLE